MQELPSPWDTYLRIQKSAKNTSIIDSRSWGLEAVMNRFLDDPEAFVSAENNAQLKTINASAARRERDHAQMRKMHAAELAPEPADPNRQLDAREVMRVIQGSMTPTDWLLLLNVAQGHKHSVLAKTVGVKPGTMRVMVSRLRAQLSHLRAA